MPTDAWIWAMLIVVVGAVAVLAICKGRGFRIGGKWGSAQIDAPLQDTDTGLSATKVLNKAEFSDADIGSIAGERYSGDTARQPVKGMVDVGNEARFTRTRIDRIVGVEQQASPKEEKP